MRWPWSKKPEPVRRRQPTAQEKLIAELQEAFEQQTQKVLLQQMTIDAQQELIEMFRAECGRQTWEANSNGAEHKQLAHSIERMKGQQ